MNYLQRREEEQNEGDQEHGTQGAHGMCAGDSRESRHGDDLPGKTFRVTRRVTGGWAAACEHGNTLATAQAH